MNKSDAILISSVPNIIYLTGFSAFSEIEREAFILITGNKKYLITDKRYSESVKKQTKGFEIIETGAIHFLVESENFFKEKNIRVLEIEENNLTVEEFKLLKKSVKMVATNFSDKRINKTKSEIQNLKKACEIGDQAFDFIITKLKTGITEIEISDELINFFKSKNADISFKPIVAYGSNSSIPHHQTGRSKLKKNQIVLLDFGVKFNNYCSDMTRTVFFGNPPKEFIRIYETVLKAQQLAISKIKDTVKASEIDKVARNYILKQNFPNIIHSVGHGIGLEVHEKPHISPNSKDILKSDMVFSVEPGIYIPGFGGVRIEDLVLVREGFPELISNAKREIIGVNDR
jgi:Xaa-Pro aminopeptidase